MRVSVFGGSQPKEGDEAYVEAQALGRLLAERGHTVLTGGYIGTMEAVSRGAHEAGGHVIGVTCGQIEAWRPVRANRWVTEERRFGSLLERLGELVTACDAAVALPGGPGTLAEVALSWNLNIIQPAGPKPLVLVGVGWQAVMDEFNLRFDATVPPAQRGLLRFATDVRQAVSMLDQGGQQVG